MAEEKLFYPETKALTTQLDMALIAVVKSFKLSENISSVGAAYEYLILKGLESLPPDKHHYLQHYHDLIEAQKNSQPIEKAGKKKSHKAVGRPKTNKSRKPYVPTGQPVGRPRKLKPEIV